MIARNVGGTVRIRTRPAASGWFGPWSESRLEGVSLQFNDDHPAAVTLLVDDVAWVFDRTLLEDVVRDLSMPAPYTGLGDVRVGREGMSQVRVWVMTPTSEAQIEIPARFVAEFVAEVARARADGDGLYDVDGWVAGMLGEGAEG